MIGLFLQAVPDDTLQSRANLGSRLNQLRRFLVQNGAHGVRGRIAAEGTLSREHFVQDAAESKKIGAAVDLLSPDLLGRHISDRSHHLPFRRVAHFRGAFRHGLGFRLQQLGQAEIQDLNRPILGQEQVFRFQVPVNDASLMGDRQSAGNLQGQLDRLTLGLGTVGHRRAKIGSFEQLRNNVGKTFVRPDIVHGENIGVIQGRGGPRFPLEALQPLRIAGEGAGQNFDRHIAMQTQIPGAINFSHAPGAQQPGNLIRAQLGSRRKLHVPYSLEAA